MFFTKLPRQYLFIFDTSGPPLYILPEFFERTVRTRFRRPDRNISKTQAIAYAEKLTEVFYGSGKVTSYITCEVPRRVKCSTVFFGEHTTEMVLVRIPVRCQEVKPTHRKYLRSVTHHPHADMLHSSVFYTRAV